MDPKEILAEQINKRFINQKYLIEKMDSMTYGNLPPFNDFKKRVGDSYNYNLKGSDANTARKVKIPANGDFDAKELYTIIKKLKTAWENGDDNAGDIASGILSTLDYEWI